MATRYFGVDKGKTQTDVVQDSGTTSKDVEIEIDLAAGMDRQQVLLAIEYIKNVILQSKWPLA